MKYWLCNNNHTSVVIFGLITLFYPGISNKHLMSVYRDSLKYINAELTDEN
jgi:hypothetical protein